MLNGRSSWLRIHLKELFFLEVIRYLEEAAKRHLSPLEIVRIPGADGGEGTVDCLVTAAKGEYKTIGVMGPLSQMRVKAKYGLINERTAVIEMARPRGFHC